jgi:DNA repair protein RecN (Recombination protein N)
MLKRLEINNFALIDRAELNFEPGFTVITGETGSGKSILLNALGLILGERADFNVIGPDSDKSYVEALFLVDSNKFEDFFKENDLDFSDELILRREIQRSGKSRAFVNDTPVGLNILKELTSNLLHIHSQYNTVELRNVTFQLELLDTLAGLNNERTNYTKYYVDFRQSKNELEKWKQEYQKLAQKLDYDQFQLEELLKLELDKHNYANIESELLRFSKSEETVAALLLIGEGFYGDAQMDVYLKNCVNSLEKLDGIDNSIDELKNRLHTVRMELKDIASEADHLAADFESDPKQIDYLTLLLDDYQRLLRKHQLNNQDDLQRLKSELAGKTENISELEHKIKQKENSLEKLESELHLMAMDLHEKRMAASSGISNVIKDILGELKLKETELEFSLKQANHLQKDGLTEIQMLFSANAGIGKVPIEKAASGGELSRVMLALQKLLSEKKTLPTILFDEIDTGVSGDVAQKIGVLLQKMGANCQLLAISHLPQVAARSNTHLKVEKEKNGARTLSKVIKLNTLERVEEIARLLSGETISPAAIENARALMN